MYVAFANSKALSVKNVSEVITLLKQNHLKLVTKPLPALVTTSSLTLVVGC
jgi:hypothetical protein